MSQPVVPKKLLALDLEMNQPSGKIIQIGAAIGDLGTKEIIETLSVVVDPGEEITPFIEQLTGVTNARVRADGVPLPAAAEKLFELARRHETFMNPVTWGGGDHETLREQLGMQNDRWLFGRRWIDVKTIHVGYALTAGFSPAGGLARVMSKRYDLPFEGRIHDAGSDAANTLRLYFKMQSLFFSAYLKE